MKTIYGIWRTTRQPDGTTTEMTLNALFVNNEEAMNALHAYVDKERKELSEHGEDNVCGLLFNGLSLSYRGTTCEYTIRLFSLVEDGDEYKL